MTATMTNSLFDILALQQLADDGCPHCVEKTVEDGSLLPAIAELERAVRAFAVLSFQRQMPLPVITIQSKGRGSAIGWFWKEKWQNGQPEKLPEINISAEYLGADVEDIAEVLLHEMCHYANYLDRIRDCSSSQYHNRHFKRQCDRIGLICVKGERRGWAWTSLSPELRETVRQVNLDPEAFSMYRAGPKYRPVMSNPELRQRRYLCKCKKSKPIRASKGLDVICSKCHTAYRECPL